MALSTVTEYTRNGDGTWAQSPVMGFEQNFLTGSSNPIYGASSNITPQSTSLFSNLGDAWGSLADFFGFGSSSSAPTVALESQGSNGLELNSMLSSGGQQSGLTGWVNDNLGGWGGVLQGIGQLGNIYTGIMGIGLQKDALDLARDSYNFNTSLARNNLQNSVKAYNNSLSDRYRSRAFAETGNANAYNDELESRKLSANV